MTIENILKRIGYNTGAVRDVLFVAKEDVTSIPLLYEENEWLLDTSEIVTTVLWNYLYFVFETCKFTEVEKVKDGNIYYEQKLVCDVAQENLNRWVNFEQMEYREFMLIIRDNNNITRFVGSINKDGEKSGMALTKTYSTEMERQKRNGYQLTFYRESAERAPIAVNILDLELQVDPGWPQGGDTEDVIPPVD